MHKLILLSVLLMSCCLAMATPRPIQIRDKGAVPSHQEMPIPADQPDVYYDDDNQELIIEGLGFVTYYDVEIASAATLTVLISTQINGSYDTIDVSSLPSDHVYVITIYSPTGNTFEGTFLIE